MNENKNWLKAGSVRPTIICPGGDINVQVKTILTRFRGALSRLQTRLRHHSSISHIRPVFDGNGVPEAVAAYRRLGKRNGQPRNDVGVRSRKEMGLQFVACALDAAVQGGQKGAPGIGCGAGEGKAHAENGH